MCKYNTSDCIFRYSMLFDNRQRRAASHPLRRHFLVQRRCNVYSIRKRCLLKRLPRRMRERERGKFNSSVACVYKCVCVCVSERKRVSAKCVEAVTESGGYAIAHHRLNDDGERTTSQLGRSFMPRECIRRRVALTSKANVTARATESFRIISASRARVYLRWAVANEAYKLGYQDTCTHIYICMFAKR